MFGITTDKESSKNFGITVLTEGCHFAGKLFCRGPSRISGKVDGEIIAEGLVIIEKMAILNTQITGKKIIIHGSVHGDIIEADEVELTKTASFHGNIKCNSLSIEAGANFCGTTQMHPPKIDELETSEIEPTLGEKTSTLQDNYAIQRHENHGVRPSMLGEEVDQNHTQDSFMAS